MSGHDEPADVGVGPWQGPWPDGDHFDPDLLRGGDRRNVADRYRYWTMDAVVADLDTRRHPFHVAIENWGHDFNIGSVVRTANAFNAAAFHIVGKRRWNRRGAMVTDRYQHEHHHPDVDDLVQWASAAGTQADGIPIIGIDNLPGSVPLETHDLPRECVLVFGQEGPGAERADAGGLYRRAAHRAVRLDPVDQRRRGRRDRHARVGASARLSPATAARRSPVGIAVVR
jgi:tRNA(Leu) C34 or U34 (ribose-2'-O)-methylase TrmL